MIKDFQRQKKESYEPTGTGAGDQDVPLAEPCGGLSCGEIGRFNMPLPEALCLSELPGLA